MRHYPADRLTALAERLLAAMGCSPAEAAVVGGHLVEANLKGHDSHGLQLLVYYAERAADGRIRPNQSVRLLEDGGAVLRFAGNRGFGQSVARQATAAAIERARAQGLVLYTLTDSMHIGRVGAYGEQALAAGLAAILFVNVIGHEPCVAPHGGREARLVTNPLCIALPGEPPFLLDMATSQIALGKVEAARAAGRPLPTGTAIDAEGRPTQEPDAVTGEPPGALLAAGLHKGYGLALACEFLAGALAGGGTIQPGTPSDGATRNNLFGLLFRPERLGNPAFAAAETAALYRYMTDTPPVDPAAPVLIPGQPEALSEAARRRDGIPLPDTTLANLLEAGEELGLARQELEKLLG